jgi:hypothetical protein
MARKKHTLSGVNYYFPRSGFLIVAHQHPDGDAGPTRTQRYSYHLGTQITDPKGARMVNQVTNRILGLGEEVEPGSVH